MHYLPRDHSYEQITVVLEGGINKEPGKLAIFKKKSEGDVGPGPMGLDLLEISCQIISIYCPSGPS